MSRKDKDDEARRARRELPEPAALDTYQAAHYVGLDRKQLERLRSEGGEDPQRNGPPFRRFGRHVRYLRKDLDAWLESHPPFGTTSQEGQEPAL
jgi:predicted DNA-binding transcriptional regulator AlpA